MLETKAGPLCMEDTHYLYLSWILLGCACWITNWVIGWPPPNSCTTAYESTGNKWSAPPQKSFQVELVSSLLFEKLPAKTLIYSPLGGCAHFYYLTPLLVPNPALLNPRDSLPIESHLPIHLRLFCMEILGAEKSRTKVQASLQGVSQVCNVRSPRYPLETVQEF